MKDEIVLAVQREIRRSPAAGSPPCSAWPGHAQTPAARADLEVRRFWSSKDRANCAIRWLLVRNSSEFAGQADRIGFGRRRSGGRIHSGSPSTKSLSCGSFGSRGPELPGRCPRSASGHRCGCRSRSPSARSPRCGCHRPGTPGRSPGNPRAPASRSTARHCRPRRCRRRRRAAASARSRCGFWRKATPHSSARRISCLPAPACATARPRRAWRRHNWPGRNCRRGRRARSCARSSRPSAARPLPRCANTPWHGARVRHDL